MRCIIFALLVSATTVCVSLSAPVAPHSLASVLLRLSPHNEVGTYRDNDAEEEIDEKTHLPVIPASYLEACDALSERRHNGGEVRWGRCAGGFVWRRPLLGRRRRAFADAAFRVDSL